MIVAKIKKKIVQPHSLVKNNKSGDIFSCVSNIKYSQPPSTLISLLMSDILFPAKYFVETKAKTVVDSGMNDLIEKNHYTKNCKSHILCGGQICLTIKLQREMI